MTKPDATFRKTLELFAYRARRVESHSLAADKTALLNLSNGQFKFEREQSKDGYRIFVVFDFPAEETMESLASRCRPFVLDRDPVYHAKILSAIGYFVQTDSELATIVKLQSQSWETLRRNKTEPIGYMTSAGAIGEGLGPYINDRDLAYRWLYGDLVHADDTTDLDHDLTCRYAAGVLLTANMAVRVISLLNVLRIACERGLITLDQSAFSQEVTARTSRRLPARMISAPVGTPVEDLEAALDSPATTTGCSDSTRCP